MGYITALELANGGIDLDKALTIHLTSNHYPPVPVSMVPVCKTAIELAINGLWDEEVALPKGVLFRGDNFAPVSAIVEAHHLDAFITSEVD